MSDFVLGIVLGAFFGVGCGIIIGFCWAWSVCWGRWETTPSNDDIAARQWKAFSDRAGADYAALQAQEYNDRRDFTGAWLDKKLPGGYLN